MNYTKKLESSQNKKLPLWEIAMILFFSVYYLLPSMNEGTNWALLLLFGFLYLFMICLKDNRYIKPMIFLIFAAVVVAGLYFILTDTKTVSQSVDNYNFKRFISKFYQVFMLFFPIFVFARIQTAANKRQKYVILFIIAALFVYVVGNTTKELQMNAEAAREWNDFEDKSAENIGTYAYVYAIPIVMVALMAWLFYMKRIAVKVLVVISIIFLFFVLLLAQYTLALIIALIGIVLQMQVSISKKSLWKFLLWVGLGIIILLFPWLLNFFAEKISSELMAERLTEVASFLGKGDSSGHNLSGRMELYKESILAFLRSPFLGNRQLDFDGHATLLTLPADIGILGAVTYFSLFVVAKKYMNALLQDQKHHYTPIFTCLILMGLTNPIHAAIPLAFATWTVAPILISVGGKEKNEETLEN